MSVSVATAGSTATSSGAPLGTCARTSASTVRVRGLITGNAVSGVQPLREPRAAGDAAGGGDEGRVGRLGDELRELLGDQERGAQAPPAATPAAAIGLRSRVQARQASAVQSVTMTTNGGATWVRLLGCERPRK